MTQNKNSMFPDAEESRFTTNVMFIVSKTIVKQNKKNE